jgi:hypothetical protein
MEGIRIKKAWEETFMKATEEDVRKSLHAVEAEKRELTSQIGNAKYALKQLEDKMSLVQMIEGAIFGAAHRRESTCRNCGHELTSEEAEKTDFDGDCDVGDCVCTTYTAWTCPDCKQTTGFSSSTEFSDGYDEAGEPIRREMEIYEDD